MGSHEVVGFYNGDKVNVSGVSCPKNPLAVHAHIHSVIVSKACCHDIFEALSGFDPTIELVSDIETKHRVDGGQHCWRCTSILGCYSTPLEGLLDAFPAKPGEADGGDGDVR